MKPNYILDTCALFSVLNKEVGAEIVIKVFADSYTGNAILSIHQINLLEIYYNIFRYYSKTKADEVIQKIKSLPINIIAEISEPLLKEAGRLKATHKISIADSIALAETSISGGTIITADHHEMDIVEQNEPNIKFLWIR
ncbi:MAG: PIN domain-containing protein [Streptococcaceae bacterium]|nr:PIN domain-containing protein [Streptococcaceae bacterium]